MKTQPPLAPGKALQKLHFPAMPKDADRCHEPAAVGARKASRSSLRIRQLQAGNFRTQLSAAPLKPRRSQLCRLKSEQFPHSIECGPIEARR